MLVVSCAETMQNLIQREGWQMVGKYVNFGTNIHLTCPKGHRSNKTPRAWKRGIRCAICSGLAKIDPLLVRKSLERCGWSLNSDYVNNHTKLQLLCPSGHKADKTWKDWQQGKRCATCSGISPLNPNFVRQTIEAEGWTLNNEYVNSYTKLHLICPEGHVADKPWEYWKDGNRCNTCAVSGFSSAKPAIVYYIRFNYVNHDYYKIGITNQTIKERFKIEPIPYEILAWVNFDNGQDARDMENKILQKYKSYRYRGKPFLHSGNTELFTTNIFHDSLLCLQPV